MDLTVKPRGIIRVSMFGMRGQEPHTPEDGFRKGPWDRSVADARRCLLFSHQAIFTQGNHGITTLVTLGVPFGFCWLQYRAYATMPICVVKVQISCVWQNPGGVALDFIGSPQRPHPSTAYWLMRRIS
jgi:hypothetical protein